MCERTSRRRSTSWMIPSVIAWGILSAALVLASAQKLCAAGGGGGGVPDGLGADLHFLREHVELGREGAYDLVGYRGAAPDWSADRLGHPQLPVLTYHFILPPETRVADLMISVDEADTLEGTFVPKPIQPEEGDEFVSPDPLIYHSPLEYPAEPILVTGDGELRGYHLASVKVYPLQYVGASRKLVLLSRLRFTGILRPMTSAELDQMARRHRPESRPLELRGEVKWIRKHAMNPHMLPEYYPTGSEGGSGEKSVEEDRPFGGFLPTEFPSLEGPPVEYVIITDSLDVGGASVGDMVSAFQDLADWKTAKGVPAVVRTVRWIDQNYPGVDRPEKIRNFLKEAYANWGTTFVLLAGDAGIVPPRFLTTPPEFNNAHQRADPPADIYYAELDWTWNEDHDAYFGRDCYDIGADHYCTYNYVDQWVGRLPAQNADEAEVMVHKILTYERAPSVAASPDTSYYNNVLLAAGLLNSSLWDRNNGIYAAELAADSLVLSQYPTDLTRVYTRLPDVTRSCNGTSMHCYDQLFSALDSLSIRPYTLLYDTLRLELNRGHQYVFHREHGERQFLGSTYFLKPDDRECDDSSYKEGCLVALMGANLGAEVKFTREIVDDLINGDNLSIVLGGGSSSNQWDLDAIGEHFLRARGGGGVAYYGKTSSAGQFWPPPQVTFFALAFLDNILTLGEVTGLCPNSGEYPLAAGIIFPLLGDPELPLWTKAPRTLSVGQTSGTLRTLGAQTVVINVKDDMTAGAVEGARVCLKQQDAVYAVAWTDGTGDATFPSFSPLSMDTVRVIVTARNYKPSRGHLKWGSVAVPHYVAYDGHDRDDGYPGDSDGSLEAGETVTLSVRGKDNGTDVGTDHGIWGYLWPTAPMICDFKIGDAWKPERVLIGARGAHPPAVQDTFRIPANWEAIRTEMHPAAPSGSDALYLMLWRDRNAIYHLATRTVGTPADSVIEGSVKTEGGLTVTNVWADTSGGPDQVHQNSAAPDSLWFYFERDATEDSLAFRAEAGDWVDVETDSMRYGTMAGGDVVARDFRVSWTGEVPDRDESVFTFALRDTNQVWWFSDFSETVHAPSVRALTMTKAWGTGSMGCSNKMTLTPTLVNLGSAEADSVVLVLHKTKGTITVSDSVVTMSRIASLDTLKAGNDFILCAGTQALNEALEYTLDVRTRLPGGDWRTTTRPRLDVKAPAAPSNLIVDELDGSVALRWVASCSLDVEGYHVFRVTANGKTRITRAPIVGSTRYEVSGLDVFDTTGAYVNYKYAITAVDSSGMETGKVAADTARVWLREHEGWPKKIRSGSEASPKVFDVDGDGKLEIFAAGKEIFAWNDDGSPLLAGNDDGLFFAPDSATQKEDSINVFVQALAIGDLDENGKWDIVGNVRLDGVWAVEYDSSNGGSATALWHRSINSRMSPPVLADLDGDGLLSVLLPSDDIDDRYIYAWEGRNPGLNGQFVRRPVGKGYQYRSVAVGDLVPDSAGLEIVQAARGGDDWPDSLFCWNGVSRRLLWGSVIPDSGQYCGSSIVSCSNPAIGDVDDDDTLEVVVTFRRITCKIGGNNRTVLGKLFIFNGATGRLESSHSSSEYDFTGIPVNPPILANLDSDASLEIVVGGGFLEESGERYPKRLRLHVFDRSGLSFVAHTGLDSLSLPGRKFEKTESVWTPIAVDFDGDEKAECLTSMNSGYLSAWEWKNQDATPERGWPQLFPDLPATPVVADLDQDGKLEMVVQDEAGFVHVLDLPGDATSVSYEWAQFGHDSQNTFNYATTVTFARARPDQGSIAGLWDSAELDRRQVNPFRPGGAIRFSSPGGVPVLLRVYDASGRRVRTLVDGVPARGRTAIVWDGRADSGYRLASGLYFVALESGKKLQTRKVLLLR